MNYEKTIPLLSAELALALGHLANARLLREEGRRQEAFEEIRLARGLRRSAKLV